MEPMSSVELKISSCRGLKSFNFFQKLCVYVTVSIISEDHQKKRNHHQKQKTPIDKDGDGDPEWNHEMKFDLKSIELSSNSYDNLFLEFDLLSGGSILADKSIGKVRVPFNDLIEEFDGAIRFISYQVKNSDGKPNGVLNFSYKLIGVESKIGEIGDGFPISYPSVDVSNPSPPAAVYYPSPIHHLHHPGSSSVAAAEVFYQAPVYPPPPEMVYYPPHAPLPPQPVLPLPLPVFYPPQPVPYGYGYGPYGLADYGNTQFGYPAVGQPHHMAPPSYGDVWHKGSPGRTGAFRKLIRRLKKIIKA